MQRVTVGSMLAMVFALEAGAQSVDMGRVEDVKHLGVLQECSGVAPSSGDRVGEVSVRRGRRSTKAPASAGTVVQLNDVFDVDSSTDVRLAVGDDRRRELGGGRFVLAPQLFCRGQGGFARDTLVSRITAPPIAAEFELGVDPSRAPNEQSLEFAVERGAALVNWYHDSPRPLIIRAVRRIVVTGTEVAVFVDRNGQNALVYVHSGVVALDTPQGQALARGQVYRVPRTGPAQVVPDAGRVMRGPFIHHSKAIWRSWWQRPAFYQRLGWAVGIAGGALGAYELLHDKGGDKIHDGTVVVSF